MQKRSPKILPIKIYSPDSSRSAEVRAIALLSSYTCPSNHRKQQILQQFRFVRPETYFSHDTALMFQESVRMAVNEIIDETTQAKGLRTMSELERKPILSSLLQQ